MTPEPFPERKRTKWEPMLTETNTVPKQHSSVIFKLSSLAYLILLWRAGRSHVSGLCSGQSCPEFPVLSAHKESVKIHRRKEEMFLEGRSRAAADLDNLFSFKQKTRRNFKSSLVAYMTGQDRTGQDRTGQDRTGQDRTGQNRTGQGGTGQGRTRQDN